MMKKSILISLIASLVFGSTQGEVSLTLGKNSFHGDEEEILYDCANFYGIRAGVYQDKNIGIQLGYEQTNKANCEGLSLKRYYTNGIVQTELENGLIPYAVGTLGYETSSKEYRPSQAFIGAGVGVKYAIIDNVNVFIETRALRSLKSENTTYATTLGLGYMFDTSTSMEVDDI